MLAKSLPHPANELPEDLRRPTLANFHTPYEKIDRVAKSHFLLNIGK